MRSALIFPSALLALTYPEKACADAYDRAFARARAAERRGDLIAAAHHLERVVGDYPQDYSIAQSLGWTYFRAERYEDALRAYRLASERAPASVDSALGVVYALAALSRCDELAVARERFTGTPFEETVHAVVEACVPRPPTAALSATGNEYLFANHPWKSSGTGGTANAWVLLAEHLVLGGAYRYTRFFTLPSSTVPDFSQNEGYADVGYVSPIFGLTLHGAVVHDGTGTLGTSPHTGASLRWSPLGDLLLDGSVSVYPDMTVLRAAPEWRVPIAGPISIEPGGAIEETAGHAYGTATLEAIFAWPRVSAWFGGKYGEEVRPAYLDAHVVYDIEEHVLFGAWCGLRARVVGPVGVLATYAYDRLRSTGPVPAVESDVHSFALGPVLEL